VASRKSIVGGPDVMLALYYGGGTAELFGPLGPKPDGDDFGVAFCEDVLESDPDHVEALAFLGNTYTTRGKYERGAVLDLRLVRLRPHSPRARYNLACTYALLGRPEDAFDELERAVDFGFRDAEHMMRDDDLASLREDPRFGELVMRARGPRSIK
jgi:tetratricopeptide (TPR) repeat protein